MRLLIIIITGTVLAFQSCEKDPIANSQVCKPENKPEITDTQNRNTPQLKGHWQLVNIQNFSNQVYLAYDSLTGRKPVLKFQTNKEVNILGPINECLGKYHTVQESGKDWLHLLGRGDKPEIGCTLIYGGEKIAKWETKYFKMIGNVTCYRINDNGQNLILQYFISKAKKGELIYKKEN